MSEDAAQFVRESLATPPFHQWLRPELADLDGTTGRITLRLPLRPEFRRDPERPEIHGGIIAALIDIAGHMAVAAQVKHGIPTIDMRVDYLRMASGRALTATATPVKVGRTVGVVDITITDDENRKVAIGRTLFSTREG